MLTPAIQPKFFFLMEKRFFFFFFFDKPDNASKKAEAGSRGTNPETLLAAMPPLFVRWFAEGGGSRGPGWSGPCLALHASPRPPALLPPLPLCRLMSQLSHGLTQKGLSTSPCCPGGRMSPRGRLSVAAAAGGLRSRTGWGKQSIGVGRTGALGNPWAFSGLHQRFLPTVP